MMTAIQRFIKLEAAGGLMLIGSAVIALVVANSPWGAAYQGLLTFKLDWTIGSFRLPYSPLVWINDALMVLFFLLVGLEIKREVLVGELSSRARMALPAVAAVGGMLVPALVYLAINRGDAEATRGWAIPAGTDIAFSLAVLTLLGSRAPASLKVFLTALAILDDLGAIAVIALFYTKAISLPALGIAVIAFGGLVAMNLSGVRRLLPYIAIGIVLWAAVLASGVHATVAGVALAATVPLRGCEEGRVSPLERLEHGIHPWVAFLVLPIFGLANSGVAIGELPSGVMTSALTLGIAAGLFFGKQLGVFGFSYAAIKLGMATLPERASWAQLYGASLLTGIGFTMSLFIGALAFGDAAQGQVRVGVLLGSFASMIAATAVLLAAGKSRSS